MKCLGATSKMTEWSWFFPQGKPFHICTVLLSEFVSRGVWLQQYLFAFLYSSWSSHGTYTGVVYHSLLQWIIFCQNSPSRMALHDGMVHSFIELCKPLCYNKAVIHELYKKAKRDCCSQTPRETNSLRRTVQIVECSLLHQQVQGRVSSLARDPDHFLCLPFIPSVYVPKPTFPVFSSLLWKMLEGDIIKLQSCFTFWKPTSYAV